jgi:hypothetical protein
MLPEGSNVEDGRKAPCSWYWRNEKYLQNSTRNNHREDAAYKRIILKLILKTRM